MRSQYRTSPSGPPEITICRAALLPFSAARTASSPASAALYASNHSWDRYLTGIALIPSSRLVQPGWFSWVDPARRAITKRLLGQRSPARRDRQRGEEDDSSE